MSKPAPSASLRTILTALTVLSVPAALADVGPPLYVSNDGVDSGDCSDAAAPCASIGYALGVAGKNAQIRVAPGSYRIDDPADAIYMFSGALTVSGGYISDNTIGAASGGQSIITGLPLEYRELLRVRGFHLIADQKGNEIQDAAAREALAQYQKTQISQPATECQSGAAGPYACNAVDLLSFVSRADIDTGQNQIADIWGFVDLNTDREYAIIGAWFGTGVFDVTDPEQPQEVGFVDGMPANWRDVKVYQFFDPAADRWQAYAYVTTDGASDGLFVIDLGSLPHRVNRVPYSSDFTSAHNVYITNTDYSTGLGVNGAAPQLIVAGAGGTGDGNNRGQFRTYSLANPTAPQFVQRIATAGYMHDATSLTISDARTAQCVNPAIDCEILVDFNENLVEIWDITDGANPSRLTPAGASPYPNTGYVHSGWWSEDRQYVFVHDELDEQNSGPVTQTTVRVFSIANLANPQLVETWSGPTGAIDHNGFVRGNRYYMSNYTRGMTILDITNPTNAGGIAFFDTYTPNDNTSFAGAWGAYPFFYSGTVAVSDINSGMFLLRDRTLAVIQGSLAFTQDSFAAAEGTQATLAVSRLGGAAGAVDVGYEILAATADMSDIVTQTGRLSWSSGDTADKSIAIDVANDGAAEDLERLIVRLVDPTGGATLATTNTASLYLNDAGAAAQVELFADTIDVTERGFGKAIVVVQRTGNANGAISVDYAVTGGDAVLATDYSGSANGTLNWADGDAGPRSIEYTIVDDGSGEADEFFEVTLSNAQGSTIAGVQAVRINIEDGLGSNTAPNAVAGASQTRPEGTTITLDGSASNDPDGDTITYAWSQVSGPTVTLSGATTATASFTAPNVNSDTLLQFQLGVTDPRGLSDTATTNVTVSNSDGSVGGGGGGGGGGSPAPLGLLLLAAIGLRRASRTDSV